MIHTCVCPLRAVRVTVFGLCVSVINYVFHMCLKRLRLIAELSIHTLPLEYYSPLSLTELMSSATAEIPLKLLQQCHSCFVTWTDKSRLFSEKLVQSCSGFLHHLSFELKIFHAMWIPTDVSKIIDVYATA